jgi:hypothetical protein
VAKSTLITPLYGNKICLSDTFLCGYKIIFIYTSTERKNPALLQKKKKQIYIILYFKKLDLHLTIKILIKKIRLILEHY